MQALKLDGTNIHNQWVDVSLNVARENANEVRLGHLSKQPFGADVPDELVVVIKGLPFSLLEDEVRAILACCPVLVCRPALLSWGGGAGWWWIFACPVREGVVLCCVWGAVPCCGVLGWIGLRIKGFRFRVCRHGWVAWARGGSRRWCGVVVVGISTERLVGGMDAWMDASKDGLGALGLRWLSKERRQRAPHHVHKCLS